MDKKRLVWLMMFVFMTIVIAGCSTQTAQKEQKEPPYPTRQIEYVVPAGAGGGTDLVARSVAEYLSKEWKQPVLVVNKTGGGNVVGCEYALKQGKPDGYTALADIQSSTSMMVGGMVNSPIKLEDRILVARIIQNPICFAVKADAPWKDFREFSEWVKKNPSELTWTSIGPSGLSAFGVGDWLKAIGVDYKKTRMIGTKGAAESLPLVAGGHAILAVHTIAEAYPLAAAGKVRILAVQAKERSPYMPDVPTVEEQGVKGMSVIWWTGVSLPKGTPDYIVKKWEAAIEKMTKDPAFIDGCKKRFDTISFMPSKEFTEFVKKETEMYTKMSTEFGIRK